MLKPVMLCNNTAPDFVKSQTSAAELRTTVTQNMTWKLVFEVL